MQVIGLMRFSYLGQGGFQVEHESLAARRAYLYAPARLDERFRTLEALALPAFRAQTDPDFDLIVVVGADFPQGALARLEAALADIPQARIRQYKPGPHRKVMAQALNDARRDPGAPCLQFRHDDDDAVAVDFVERLRQAARDSAGLVARNRMVGIDFNRGFVARADAQGVHAEASFKPYWGVALGMAVAPGVRHTIMNFGHNRLPRFMPTLTFTDSDMYVRGHNEHNDSRQSGAVSRSKLEPLTDTLKAHFRARFAIDADHVQQVFAAPPPAAT